MDTMHDIRAQAIASAWHGGGGSALYMFASTGAIHLADMLAEIDQNRRVITKTMPKNQTDLADFDALARYIVDAGERGPIADWYTRVICA